MRWEVRTIRRRPYKVVDIERRKIWSYMPSGTRRWTLRHVLRSRVQAWTRGVEERNQRLPAVTKSGERGRGVCPPRSGATTVANWDT